MIPGAYNTVKRQVSRVTGVGVGGREGGNAVCSYLSQISLFTSKHSQFCVAHPTPQPLIYFYSYSITINRLLDRTLYVRTISM